MTKYTSNKQRVEFPHENGKRVSSIEAVPTSEDAGRSEGLSLLIIDEAAWIRNFDELWTGLLPTVSTGGRVIILSTPKGVGGQYHKIYTEAELGINEFNPIRLPWDVHPERDEEWFKGESQNLGSHRKVAQELLCDFVASGETFLSLDDLEWVRASIKPPVSKWGPQRNMWVWKDPLSEHKYIISADVARGDGPDFSAFNVIDVTSDEVVADYKGKIPADRFGEFLDEVGRKYNDALIAVERNSFGLSTVTRLKDLNYPRVYHPKVKSIHFFNYVPKFEDQKAGFDTNAKTRGLILAKLEEVLRNKTVMVRSQRLYDELQTFVWKGSKAQSMKGYHDDLVISLSIGLYLFDASGDYSKYSTELNDAMIKAMSRDKSTLNDLKKQTNSEDPSSGNPFTPPDAGAVYSTTAEDRQEYIKQFGWLVG